MIPKGTPWIDLFRQHRLPSPLTIRRRPQTQNSRKMWLPSSNNWWTNASEGSFFNKNKKLTNQTHQTNQTHPTKTRHVSVKIGQAECAKRLNAPPSVYRGVGRDAEHPFKICQTLSNLSSLQQPRPFRRAYLAHFGSKIVQNRIQNRFQNSLDL